MKRRLPVVAGHEAGANAIVAAEASVKAVGREQVPHFHEQMGMTILPCPRETQ